MTSQVLADMRCWECGEMVSDGGPCPAVHPGFTLRAARSRGYVFESGVGEVHTREGFAVRRNGRAEEQEMVVREAQIAEIEGQIAERRERRALALEVLRSTQAEIAWLEARRDNIRRMIRPTRFEARLEVRQ